MPLAIVVTGTAHRSIGEALVGLSGSLKKRMVCVDIRENRSLANVEQVVIDLNLLSSKKAYPDHVRQMQRKLSSAICDVGCRGIGAIIQCAGVYDASRFEDHLLKTRACLIGLNFLGRLELLHCIMNINRVHGVDNSRMLTYVDVASSHALDISKDKAVYVASKAATLPLCAALVKGKELARVVYFAPGPVDTHMLHRNHWAIKNWWTARVFQEGVNRRRRVLSKNF